MSADQCDHKWLIQIIEFNGSLLSGYQLEPFIILYSRPIVYILYINNRKNKFKKSIAIQHINCTYRFNGVVC